MAEVIASEDWKPNIYTAYLHEINDPARYKATMKWLICQLKQIQYNTGKNIDSIAIRGTSGVALGYAAAAEIGCRVSHIRKQDGSHLSGCLIEGMINPRNYVILDDFIATGRTIDKIIRTIDKVNGYHIEPMAILLWRQIGQVSTERYEFAIPRYNRGDVVPNKYHMMSTNNQHGR